MPEPGSGAAVDLSPLVAEVLAGKRKSVARMMTHAETTGDVSRALIAEVHRYAGRAHIVGLTGVPGSGKSTMVRALAQRLRAADYRVGIVAVDPSSPFSGGAILGDRVRMLELSGDPGIFIRSMATRGALGGLARATHDVVDVLDAAGYDIVLIETVGVGQDEVDIIQAAHSIVVVSAPGLGDEIQAIKAGVLEIADIHVVSKCDKPEASETVADLKGMLHLGATGAGGQSMWKVPVIATSAQSGKGMDTLIETLTAHRAHLRDSGELAARRRHIAEMRILKAAEEIIRERVMQGGRETLDRLLDRAVGGELDPHSAAVQLLDGARRPG